VTRRVRGLPALAVLALLVAMPVTASGTTVGPALRLQPVAAVAGPLASSAGASTPKARAAAPAIPADGAATPGSLGVRLLDAPRSAGADPRALLYIVDHLPPGTVIRRRIEVSSTARTRTRATLYPAAATIAKGSFLGAAGRTANELSTWMSVTPGVVDLPAGGRVTAEVTVTIPADASPGERYGVVWAETRSSPAAGGNIVDVNRVGIRLYLSIGPGGAPAADFRIESLAAERTTDGRPVVVARVRNTGGRALDLSGTLNLLDGPGGLHAGPFNAKLGTTLSIGATEAVTIPLDQQVPAGPWDARLTLRSGLVEHTARATITFPASGSAAAVSTASFWRPWMVFLAVLVVVLLALAAFVLFRRQQGAAPADSSRRH
jgi:hypothetical protein